MTPEPDWLDDHPEYAPKEPTEIADNLSGAEAIAHGEQVDWPARRRRFLDALARWEREWFGGQTTIK